MIRSRRLNRRFALLLSALMLSPSSALANPLGGQVVAGQGNIQGQGTATVTVNQQSQNAIFNWSSFSISAGERTQFIQPSASSIALNRVVGSDVSQLYG
ncbi:MAG TPA: filamentous hemagglutinin N-terminal domain-containing protein, partial [Xanthobacteraceae bacterium]|nr:filamentous hemagglutinin N-terminal domain-containing protein [Xanthobacteraceae bacterium]